MDQIIECVPNFSEGRDKGIIDAIARAIEAVKDVHLLDVDPGADTNRTVVTFVGTPEGVEEAAFQAIKTAADLIDMKNHQGAHARMGATDVCPFIPVKDVTKEDCVEISKRVSKRVAQELGIPVFLYEDSATKPERKNLATIREGEYEGLSEKLKDPKWAPDFGEAKFNPRSGATVIGAREFLIAYNINFNTREWRYANDIALNIREKGRVKRSGDTDIFYRDGDKVFDEDGNKVYIPGRFKCVKAVGWYIDEYKQAQLSMNLTNYRVSPIHDIFDFVCEEAARRKLRVTGSELVGLIPLEPMQKAGVHYLRAQRKLTGVPEQDLIHLVVKSMGLDDLKPFDPKEKIIEFRLQEDGGMANMPLRDFVDEVSRDSPAPGGGSIAALAGALGAALPTMVANLTWDGEYLPLYDDMCDIGERGQALKKDLIDGIEKDANAFDKVLDAMRLPKGTDDDNRKRDEAILSAYKDAVNVPLDTARKCLMALKLANEAATKGLKSSVSDAGVGALMAHAGLHGAALNVKINLPSIKDQRFNNETSDKIEQLVAEGDSLLKEVLATVNEKIGSKD